MAKEWSERTFKQTNGRTMQQQLACRLSRMQTSSCLRFNLDRIQGYSTQAQEPHHPIPPLPGLLPNNLRMYFVCLFWVVCFCLFCCFAGIVCLVYFGFFAHLFVRFTCLCCFFHFCLFVCLFLLVLSVRVYLFACSFV